MSENRLQLPTRSIGCIQTRESFDKLSEPSSLVKAPLDKDRQPACSLSIFFGSTGVLCTLVLFLAPKRKFRVMALAFQNFFIPPSCGRATAKRRFFGEGEFTFSFSVRELA